MRRRCGRGARRGSEARSPARSRGPGPGTEPEAPMDPTRNPDPGTHRSFGSWSWRRFRRAPDPAGRIAGRHRSLWKDGSLSFVGVGG